MKDTNKQSLVVLSGPTAAGKTALSIKLAKDISGSIISADSMQVYKYMDIGSAKISKDEMQGIKHYLIDVLEPEEEFNIALFKMYAKNDIELIKKDNKIPIVVGGTGFYIQSLIYDIDFSEEASENSAIRDELCAIANQKGNDYLHGLLKSVDEKSANEIHPNNVKRVIRALEYYKLTGEMISEHNESQHLKTSPYNFVYFVVNQDREKLYKNIDKRVDEMVRNGLVDEVKLLKDRGLTKHNVSMQGIGYKEILSYLDNEISLEEAIDIIKRDTRHFAKRQLTWFRREKDVVWINKEDFDYEDDLILEFMKERLKSEGII